MAIIVTKVIILDSKQVKLILPPQRDGVTYNLSIANVQDVGGNIISPAASPIQFTGVGILPQVATATHVDITHIDIEFDMPMTNDANLVYADNYTITGPISETVLSVTRLNDTTVRLEVDTDLVTGTYTIEVINVTDTGGNLIDPAHDEGTVAETIYHFRDHATLEQIPGLVAYYKLDGDGLDAYTNGIDCTPTGKVLTAATQVIGTAMWFDQSHDLPGEPIPYSQFELAASPILDNLTAVSVSLWVYIGALPAVGSFTGLLGRMGQCYIVITSSTWFGHLFFYVYKSDQTKTIGYGENPVITGQWNHIVYTYSGTTMTTYLNGALDKATTGAVSPMGVVDATNPWYMGCTRNVMAISGNTNRHSHLDGNIDEAGIWNRALTLTEVIALYNAGAGLKF